MIPAHLPETVVGEGCSQAIQNRRVGTGDKKTFFTSVTESHTPSNPQKPSPHRAAPSHKWQALEHTRGLCPHL